MQFQADILDTVVIRSKNTETTLIGVAYLAGICIGLWQQEDIDTCRKVSKTFISDISSKKRKRLYKK
jgi:glycerol kinase